MSCYIRGKVLTSIATTRNSHYKRKVWETPLNNVGCNMFIKYLLWIQTLLKPTRIKGEANDNGNQKPNNNNSPRLNLATYVYSKSIIKPKQQDKGNGGTNTPWFSYPVQLKLTYVWGERETLRSTINGFYKRYREFTKI